MLKKYVYNLLVGETLLTKSLKTWSTYLTRWKFKTFVGKRSLKQSQYTDDTSEKNICNADRQKYVFDSKISFILNTPLFMYY